jgi:hypothetical protein
MESDYGLNETSNEGQESDMKVRNLTFSGIAGSSNNHYSLFMPNRSFATGSNVVVSVPARGTLLSTV